MDDLTQWQEQNRKYREAAVHWLRLRLTRLAHKKSPSAPPMQRGWGPWRGASHIPEAGIHERDIEKAEEVMEEAARMDPPPALLLLEKRFTLATLERNILLLCAAIEMAPGLAELCALAQGDRSRTYPTFALALDVFDDPNWSVVSPERPLRHWRLVELNQQGAVPLTIAPLRADERISAFILGLNYLDQRLAPLVTPVPHVDLEDLPESAREAVRGIEQRVGRDRDAHSVPVVQLVGADAESKDQVASAACRAMGMTLYRLPIEALPSQAAELENLDRLWERESVLLPVALSFDTHDADEASPQVAAMQRWLSRAAGLFFLKTRDVRTGLERPSIVVDVEKPTPHEQRRLWQAQLGDHAKHVDIDQLSEQFRLNGAAIARIARSAEASGEQGHHLFHRIWTECLREARPRLDTLAQRIHAKATWDDIVLPDEESVLLREIASQVRNRGRVYDQWGFRARMNRGLGISALFAGESGSGKTMAAEVIANDLRLNLYRIDLSAVVSKYIGETEKNLRKLFDAAEDGGAILLFDEADALFGKRSEVKDSHDRYANIEINYLLQRMEAFGGLAILATNMKGALDQAFLRRLRFVVNFPFPSQKERKKIWQRAFPPNTPVGSLDYDRLAMFNLTGGSIANIALNAAFLAAGRVEMPQVLLAIRTELRKLDRPVNEADFKLAAKV